MTTKPVMIYFRAPDDNDVTKGDAIVVLAYDNVLPVDVVVCNSWNDFSDVLKLDPHQIIFHVSMLTHTSITVYEFVDMIRTLKKVTVGYQIPLAVSIERDTPAAMIKEFQKCDLHGIVPSSVSFGIDETYKGIQALFNRIPYWPKHILEQLPGAKQPKTEIYALTPRQFDVLNLIKDRGLSNKQIAKALHISESTVKLHITEIFKKYGVRTRTQLAVFSHS
jgi:DNA-binding NarL/FixJ family response regulator